MTCSQYGRLHCSLSHVPGSLQHILQIQSGTRNVSQKALLVYFKVLKTKDIQSLEKHWIVEIIVNTNNCKWMLYRFNSSCRILLMVPLAGTFQTDLPGWSRFFFLLNPRNDTHREKSKARAWFSGCKTIISVIKAPQWPYQILLYTHVYLKIWRKMYYPQLFLMKNNSWKSFTLLGVVISK